MTILIFADKESEEPGIHVAPKDQRKERPGSSGKVYDGRSQNSIPHVCKIFDAPPVLPKATRKTLGTVDRAAENSVKTNGPLKQKRANFSAKKVIEKTVKAKRSVPALDDTYPEIEKFFPFSSLDFESFVLPEKHQITQFPLKGVPLMSLDEEQELEKLLHLGPPSPLKIPFHCGSPIRFSLLQAFH